MQDNILGEWGRQWKEFKIPYNKDLFLDWIYPNTLNAFENKLVLDAGCGTGQHSRFVSTVAKHVNALDKYSSSIAKQNNNGCNNIEYIASDIMHYAPGYYFDVVFSVGVIHHTDDPQATVNKLKSLLKPGGKLMVWVYSKEGNWINEHIIEFFKKTIVSRMSHEHKLLLAKLLTLVCYAFVYTIYLLPLKFLPYYKYFANWRIIGWYTNLMNIFDKLNAPKTFFISKQEVESWARDLTDVHISHQNGVGWRMSGNRP